MINVEGDSSVSSLKNVSEDEGNIYDEDSDLLNLQLLKPDNKEANGGKRKMSQEVHNSKERMQPQNYSPDK